jgi:hypothetical protein
VRVQKAAQSSQSSGSSFVSHHSEKWFEIKTNPSVWLEDYCLACRAGGADDDLFIIQFLPIYVANSARAWLDHLPRNIIDNWKDLKDIFINNF